MTRDALSAVGAFALITALGLDEGGYAPSAWGWSGFAVLVVLAVLLARGAALPARPGLVFVGSFIALGGWVALSLLWTTHPSATVLEVERLVLYAAAAAVFTTAGASMPLLGGALAAITALCAYGLTTAEEGQRLAEPVGYANGVGILAVMGLLAACGLSVRWRLAALPVPVLAAALYLSFSRGAWLALGIGLVAAVVLAPNRLRLAAGAVSLAAPAGLAVLAARELAVSGALAIALLGLCAAAFAISWAMPRVPAPGPRARAAFAVTLLVLPLLVVAAGLAQIGGPGAAWRSFRAAPNPTHGQASARVFDLSGRNRADYWDVAWKSYEAEPVLGIGAGSYGRAWLRERPVPQPVTDAHSLYLEMLAELGPLGLVLLLAALAAPFAAGRSVALGPYAAFLAHAGQDWDWELPAVTVAALVCGAAALRGARGRPLPRVPAIVPAALAVLVALAWAGNSALERSVDAMDSLRWEDAAASARTARRLQPWSPEPLRVLGEVELAEGSLEGARRHFGRGIEKDADEFELWIGLGLASDGTERRRALERAAELNPLSPDLREIGFESP